MSNLERTAISDAVFRAVAHINGHHCQLVSRNGHQFKGWPWLARIMPWVESRLILLEPIVDRGRRLFELACDRDLEGIVAKWNHGTHQSGGRGTSWFKVKSPSL